MQYVCISLIITGHFLWTLQLCFKPIMSKAVEKDCPGQMPLRPYGMGKLSRNTGSDGFFSIRLKKCWTNSSVVSDLRRQIQVSLDKTPSLVDVSFWYITHNSHIAVLCAQFQMDLPTESELTENIILHGKESNFHLSYKDACRRI